MRFKILRGFGLAALLTVNLTAGNYLFFIELQTVAGYSSKGNEVIFYSHHPLAPMQKPSIGFDYIRKFSSDTGDIASLFIQPRLALSLEDKTGFEFQIYNAYLKFKLNYFDLWFGHNKPAFGLSLNFDTHAHLLQPLTMNGFYPERDWGIGLVKDFPKSSISMSMTTGSGMDLFFRGNWLVSFHYSRGFLSSDNWQAGISLSLGKTANKMMPDQDQTENPVDYRMAGADFSFVVNNLENRAELLIGRIDNENTFALFWRSSVSFIEDGKLKLELQPVLIRENRQTRAEIYTGVSYALSAYTTFRGMSGYNTLDHEWRIIIQIYYTRNLN